MIDTLAPEPPYLADLNPPQREAVLTTEGPVLVLAGAGTGKTRAITHRIAYGVATGVYNPTEVLAVTFPTRAAGEMRTRLRALGAGGVQARTFHSAALRQALADEDITSDDFKAALPIVDEFLPSRTLRNLADLAAHLNTLAPRRSG